MYSTEGGAAGFASKLISSGQTKQHRSGKLELVAKRRKKFVVNDVLLRRVCHLAAAVPLPVCWCDFGSDCRRRRRLGLYRIGPRLRLPSEPTVIGLQCDTGLHLGDRASWSMFERNGISSQQTVKNRRSFTSIYTGNARNARHLV
jgi:hypothetical protein